MRRNPTIFWPKKTKKKQYMMIHRLSQMYWMVGKPWMIHRALIWTGASNHARDYRYLVFRALSVWLSGGPGILSNAYW